MSHLSDLDLLKAMRNNDEAAFAELFNRYWSYVYTITYKRVQSKALAKEIVLDLFVSLWAKRRTLSVYHMPSYLYVCVKNMVQNRLSAKDVPKEAWEDQQLLVPREIEEQVKAELNTQPASNESEEEFSESNRSLTSVAFFNGRSIKDLNDTMNASEKSFYVNFNLSLKKLRIHLKNIALSFLFIIH